MRVVASAPGPLRVSNIARAPTNTATATLCHVAGRVTVIGVSIGIAVNVRPLGCLDSSSCDPPNGTCPENPQQEVKPGWKPALIRPTQDYENRGNVNRTE